MKGFLVAIGWLILVVWCAIRIGFAQQSIDPAVAFITDPSICQTANAPVISGSCRIEGRIEGGLDYLWHMYADTTPPDGIALPKSVALQYQADDYRFRGGSVAVYAMVILTFLVAALPGIVRVRRRRLQ